jgi:predicted GNAT family acetyltransferase
MTLTVRRFDDPTDFAEAAMLFLLAREEEHCLIIGIVGQLIDDPGYWPGTPTLLTVDRHGVPVAAAIRTPPHVPILSRVEHEDAIPLLVEQFRAEPDVGGVRGPAAETRAFAGEWTRQTGQPADLALSERLYTVERVRPVAGVPGAMRRATDADRALLRDWSRAFIDEAFGEQATEDRLDRWVDHRLRGEQSGLVLWEDGEPVSMAGFTGPTPDGIRIGPVFTPKPVRGRGYARALTAALSQHLIDDGRRFCLLYTDLTNPTSNYIYEQIGYEPIADAAEYRFR